MPRPKWPCQMRLTITRAVSGLRGSVSHRASSSRPLGPAEIGRRREQAVEQVEVLPRGTAFAVVR